MPELTESAIVNLERRPGPRPRRKVTVEEWLVLSAALEVPPVALVLPLGWSTTVRLLPGPADAVGDALAWLQADYDPEWPDPKRKSSIPARGKHPAWFPRPMDRQTLGAIELIRGHAELVRAIERWLRQPAMRLNLSVALEALANLRAELSRRGEVLPEVSPEVADALVSPPSVWAEKTDE
jgi:hypothetical protein